MARDERERARGYVRPAGGRYPWRQLVELRRGPLIELTSEWRVRIGAYAGRAERRVADTIKRPAARRSSPRLGAVFTPIPITTTRTFYIWRTSRPRRRRGGRRHQRTSRCQLPSEINDDVLLEMLMFADDRQLADLRTACLSHVQRRWNSNLHNRWHNADGADVPGADVAKVSAVPERRRRTRAPGYLDAVCQDSMLDNNVVTRARRRRRRRSCSEHAVEAAPPDPASRRRHLPPRRATSSRRAVSSVAAAESRSPTPRRARRHTVSSKLTCPVARRPGRRHELLGPRLGVEGRVVRENIVDEKRTPALHDRALRSGASALRRHAYLRELGGDASSYPASHFGGSSTVIREACGT